MENEIKKLIAEIKVDYAKSCHNENMVQEFNNSISIVEGKKYIKIVVNRSVWGFICKKTEGKFNSGDILLAANWSTPAKNKARGNVFSSNNIIRWTGPLYLNGGLNA